MINYSDAQITTVSAHYIGNKSHEQDLLLSQQPLNIADGQLNELMLKYFLDAFEADEFFAFDFSNGDLSLNPAYQFCKNIFANPDDLHANSQDIAKHLYEQTNHPKIKSGDLYVAYFSGIILDDEVLDAIGFFKSENKQSFLKLKANNADFKINYEEGTAIDKLDKGCLIFNTNEADGYKVCIVDKSNKSLEAQYWREQFLHLKPLSDNYFHTTHYIRMAKDFVVNKLPEDFPVTKAEKIDYLNKSLDYFKGNEKMVEADFADTVFEDSNMAQAFREYKTEYQNENGFEVKDEFDISTPSVKKQARAMRSVLKLDKNFHVYIHGDNSLIERGYDEATGKSFYKLFFEEES